MTVELQNFEMYAGDSKVLSILVEDEDNNLPALDLTGCTATFVVFDPYIDQILITKTTASGISIPSPTNGIILITLNPEDTELVKPVNWYRHETEIVDSFGNVTTTTTGFLKIKKSKA